MKNVKITRTGQARAKKMLDKLISRSEFMARNPTQKEIDTYDMIRKQLELGAAEGFISRIQILDSKRKSTKPKASAK
ncbi:hypothetical protein [Pseudobdellovibrio exovorus]|nr:hypothetical protein [Pseudobdellovibrio exovorus]